MGDFNNDMLKVKFESSSEHTLINLSSNCLHLQILLPIWISGNSKTIIDTMFSNITGPLMKNVTAGNITLSISDHLPQFFFLPDFLSNNYIYLQEKC